jgi:hypothetical protein
MDLPGMLKEKIKVRPPVCLPSHATGFSGLLSCQVELHDEKDLVIEAENEESREDTVEGGKDVKVRQLASHVAPRRVATHSHVCICRGGCWMCCCHHRY